MVESAKSNSTVPHVVLTSISGQMEPVSSPQSTGSSLTYATSSDASLQVEALAIQVREKDCQLIGT